MLPLNIEGLARTLLPGAGAVSLRCLGTGLLHTTYRAMREGLTYALRVPADCAPLRQDRRFEIRVLEQAAAAGLAPRLINADEQSGALLLEWMPGESWSEAQARSLKAVEKLARLLLAVHALPIPEPAQRMDAKDWIERYTRALWPRTPGAVRQFGAAATRAMSLLQQLALPQGPVVCHSDLHRFNVLQREGEQLLLLDWEYAHVTDGYWDLAGWCANNDLPEEKQRALLSAYVGAAATESQWGRFRLHSWLYDYVCLLWIELSVHLRPAQSAELVSRGAWLERRLRLPVYGRMMGCS